jgi:hypothetical protein
MLGQLPPSQQDSTFWRQSAHHHAERIQKSRCGSPVIAQIMGTRIAGDAAAATARRSGDPAWRAALEQVAQLVDVQPRIGQDARERAALQFAVQWHR